MAKQTKSDRETWQIKFVRYDIPEIDKPSIRKAAEDTARLLEYFEARLEGSEGWKLTISWTERYAWSASFINNSPTGVNAKLGVSSFGNELGKALASLAYKLEQLGQGQWQTSPDPSTSVTDLG